MSESITEQEIAELLTMFGEYTKGRGAQDFINSSKHIVATQLVLMKAQQDGCQLPSLLQLVAWGSFMAEKGETRLTTEVQ